MSDEPFPGSPDDMMYTIAAPRARVAKLDAALQHARGVIEVIMGDGNCDCRKDFTIIDAALKDAPQ